MLKVTEWDWAETEGRLEREAEGEGLLREAVGATVLLEQKEGKGEEEGEELAHTVELDARLALEG